MLYFTPESVKHLKMKDSILIASMSIKINLYKIKKKIRQRKPKASPIHCLASLYTVLIL